MSPIQRYFNSINQGRSLWWHWLLGLFFILAIYFGVAFLMAAAFYAVLIGLEISDDSGLLEFGFLLATFLPLFFGVWLIQRFWHQRSLTRLLTYTSRFRWRYLLNAMIVFVVVMLIMSTISTVFWPEEWEKYQRNPDMNIVFMGGILTLIFIPFQAASEEFLTRGYLNQLLIKYVKNPWIVFFITSTAFALLHAWNSESEGQFLPYMTAIFLFGFAACILLYFEGGLESAIGLHIINNIFAFSILGYEDPWLPNTALFYSGRPEIGWTEVGWELISLSLMVMGILWLNRRTQIDNEVPPDPLTETFE